MSHIDLVALAHQMVREVVHQGDIVIDATLGNGHDALFLAQLIGERGYLYGFDIQATAIVATQQRLAEQGVLSCATLINAGHETMTAEIPAAHHGRIKAVMFNLGYLPGYDHTVRTHATTTLQALESARKLLAPDGVLNIIAYIGHEHGREEAELVKRWAQVLKQEGYDVEITIPPSRYDNAPVLLIVRNVEERGREG